MRRLHAWLIYCNLLHGSYTLSVYEQCTIGSLPRTDRALALCIAISIRCLKKKVDLGSPESAANRRPNAETRYVAPNPQTPIVSIATGMKMCV